MPRISQLPSLTTADNTDEIAIVDVSASTTKKITRGDLLKAPLPTKSVTLPAINGGTTAGVLTTDASGNVTVGAKTTDANGWRVVDMGIYKIYTKRFGPYNVTTGSALMNERHSLATNQAAPVGVAGLANVTVSATAAAGTDTSRITPSLESFSAGTFSIWVNFAKVGTGSMTFSGIQIDVTLIDR